MLDMLLNQEGLDSVSANRFPTGEMASWLQTMSWACGDASGWFDYFDSGDNLFLRTLISCGCRVLAEAAGGEDMHSLGTGQRSNLVQLLLSFVQCFPSFSLPWLYILKKIGSWSWSPAAECGHPVRGRTCDAGFDNSTLLAWEIGDVRSVFATDVTFFIIFENPHRWFAHVDAAEMASEG